MTSKWRQPEKWGWFLNWRWPKKENVILKTVPGPSLYDPSRHCFYQFCRTFMKVYEDFILSIHQCSTNNKFWFPHIAPMVKEYVGSYLGCVESVPFNPPAPIITRDPPTRPWQVCCPDFKGPIGGPKGYYCQAQPKPQLQLRNGRPGKAVKYSQSH